MTKAQERADAIAARKQVAFTSKVHRLLGHLVAARSLKAEIVAAYRADIEAEVIAAQIASREPVGRAIHPLKAQAVARASLMAEAEVNKVREVLAAADWNLDLVAPRADRSLPYGSREREDANAKRRYFESLTVDTLEYRGPFDKSPLVVRMADEKVARFVNRAELLAASQYDAFICKLVAKVGDVVDAVLEGDHVWSASYLRVTLPSGAKQTWYTKQIVNFTKYGDAYNQWPTILLKGAAR